MTQKEFDCRMAENSATLSKELLEYQRRTRDLRQALAALTKNYTKEKEDLERKIQDVQVLVSEARARHATEKASLNAQFLASEEEPSKVTRYRLQATIKPAEK